MFFRPVPWYKRRMTKASLFLAFAIAALGGCGTESPDATTGAALTATLAGYGEPCVFPRALCVPGLHCVSSSGPQIQPFTSGTCQPQMVLPDGEISCRDPRGCPQGADCVADPNDDSVPPKQVCKTRVAPPDAGDLPPH
jgi:hypothetical protein